MKLPQVVIYESDGFLAAQTRRLAKENGWLVRESRRPDSCVGLVSEVRPSVLLIRLGGDLQDGLSLLCDVVTTAPDCPVILVCDAKLEGADLRAQLSALAFDLGARYIIFPPLQQPVIEDLVSGLMFATIGRVVSPNEESAGA